MPIQNKKDEQIVKERFDSDYKAGFTTNVESNTLPPGLNEDVVAKISKMKNEPDWLLQYRLKAYRLSLIHI